MPPAESPTVTVVSGLPRSGTSLMMQMLTAGGLPILRDDLRPPDPDNPRGYQEYEPVKRTRDDPSWLPLAAGKAVKVVHQLLYCLPGGYRYPVLLMRRPVEEVVASQRVMLARRGQPGARLPDGDLARVFQAQMERLESWLRTQPRFRVLSVSYPDLLAGPAAGAAAVAAFLNAGLDAGAMARAVDPTLYRQRAPRAGSQVAEFRGEH